MGFPNLGVLAQTLIPAISGGHRGQILAEKETYERSQQKKRDHIDARRQALMDTILANREAREAELHPLEKQYTQARTLGALPEYEAPETLGGETELDRLKLDEIRSRIRENNAQADAAGRSSRDSHVSKTEAARIEREEAEGQAFLSTAARGGGRDPIIGEFGKAFQSVRKLHPEWSPGRVAYRAKSMLSSARPDLFPNRQKYGEVPEVGGGEEDMDLPYAMRKFPSEDLPSYLRRLKQNGVDQDTATRYLVAQGLDTEE